jgi:hypothetical protein
MSGEETIGKFMEGKNQVETVISTENRVKINKSVNGSGFDPALLLLARSLPRGSCTPASRLLLECWVFVTAHA